MKIRTALKIILKFNKEKNNNNPEIIKCLQLFCEDKEYCLKINNDGTSNLIKNNKRKKRRKKTKKPIERKSFKEKYHEYLDSKVWALVKKKLFSIKQKSCEACGSIKNIEVHHKSYDKKTMDGESLKNLIVLCRNCHEEVHRLKIKTKLSLIKATEVVLGRNHEN